MAILTGRVPASGSDRCMHGVAARRRIDTAVKKMLHIENNRRIVRGLRPLRLFFHQNDFHEARALHLQHA